MRSGPPFLENALAARGRCFCKRNGLARGRTSEGASPQKDMVACPRRPPLPLCPPVPAPPKKRYAASPPPGGERLLRWHAQTVWGRGKADGRMATGNITAMHGP